MSELDAGKLLSFIKLLPDRSVYIHCIYNNRKSQLLASSH